MRCRCRMAYGRDDHSKLEIVHDGAVGMAFSWVWAEAIKRHGPQTGGILIFAGGGRTDGYANTRADTGRADHDSVPGGGSGLRRIARDVRGGRSRGSEGTDRAQPRRVRGDDLRSRWRVDLDGGG